MSINFVPTRILKLSAPAKINLHLRVGPRRSDGFHPLLSWMTTIGLFDTLNFFQKRAESAPAAAFLTCDDPTLACDSGNLVYRAAVAFENHSIQRPAVATAAGSLGKTSQELAPPGGSVSIHLEKRIPAGGGLGGGSSDAAHTLLGMNQLSSSPLAAAQLKIIAAELGSDVPFFLFGPSSICKGRGEAVRPVGVPTGAKWVTLVLPPIGMPTADVYRRFDQMNLGKTQDIEQEPRWQNWTSLPSRELLDHLVNDLEPPAFSLRTDLADLQAKFASTLNRPVRMSGSGSSLFTLYDDQSQAQDAANKIKADHRINAVAVELCPP